MDCFTSDVSESHVLYNKEIPFLVGFFLHFCCKTQSNPVFSHMEYWVISQFFVSINSLELIGIF